MLRAVRVQRSRNAPDVLGGVVVIDDLGPLWAEMLGGQIPDPVRAIAQDHDWPQDGLGRTDHSQAGIRVRRLGPLLDLQCPAAGRFG